MRTETPARQTEEPVLARRITCTCCAFGWRLKSLLHELHASYHFHSHGAVEKRSYLHYFLRSVSYIWTLSGFFSHFKVRLKGSGAF